MRPCVHWIHWPQIAVLGLAAVAGGIAARQTPRDSAQERERELRATYEVEAWPSGPLRDGFPLPGLTLEGWEAGPLRSDRGRMRRRFDAEGEGPRGAFLVEAYVADDAAGAHEVLLSWLAGRQSPTPATPGRDRDLEIGDVAFLDVGRVGADEIVSWIALARGNVAVRLTNLDPRADPELDLAAIAGRLDAAVTERAELDPGAAIPRPEIASLSAQERELKAGDVTRIDFQVTDPAGGEPHLQWVVGGPGQGYVERHEDGGWYLHTTGPGGIELALEVTGSTGTFARESIELSVAGD